MDLAFSLPDGFLIERLDTSIHRREDFSCGTAALDTYLKTQASQSQKKYQSTTHVLTEISAQQPRPVVGYVSVLNTELFVAEAPDWVQKANRKRYLPALLIARMAVDSKHQGKRLGEYLLKYAIKIALDISLVSGCSAVLLDAKDENVRKFYEKYGFESFPDRQDRMFLPLETIKKAIPGGTAKPHAAH